MTSAAVDIKYIQMYLGKLEKALQIIRRAKKERRFGNVQVLLIYKNMDSGSRLGI